MSLTISYKDKHKHVHYVSITFGSKIHDSSLLSFDIILSCYHKINRSLSLNRQPNADIQWAWYLTISFSRCPFKLRSREKILPDLLQCSRKSLWIFQFGERVWSNVFEVRQSIRISRAREQQGMHDRECRIVYGVRLRLRLIPSDCLVLRGRINGRVFLLPPSCRATRTPYPVRRTDAFLPWLRGWRVGGRRRDDDAVRRNLRRGLGRS